ncbi:MAG TPA: efflux RND transporter periplasmic adaptor subunit [Gemmatimonadales bacterium]|nr:efflux RND transporter periplasmic adaptor subunit [Gemmatimonadales bacterium]
MKSLRSSLLLPVVAAWACGRAPEAAPIATGPVREVPAQRVRSSLGIVQYEAAGTVRAVRRVELATRLMGTIRSVRVRAGDRVTAGQLLLTLEEGSPEAGLVQARAGLDLATRTLQRMERLYADSAVPLAQLDAARAAHAQAEGQVRAAQVEVGYAGLHAPFAGVVTARLAEPGDLAAPGQRLLVIEDAGAREIVVGVPDDLLVGIRQGLIVPVRIGAGERRVDARVIAVVPFSDPGSRTAEVRLAAPAGLPSGASAVAEFPVGRAGGLRVPAGSLVRRGQLVGVFVFTADSTVRLRWIRVGRVEAGTMEVMAGLDDGDLIALRPDSLSDGARARPRLDGSAP